MRELTKKALAVGIIPESAKKLLQFWGMLEGSPEFDSQKRRTEEHLTLMVEEIAELLEAKSEEPEIKETDLDLGQEFSKQAAPSCLRRFNADKGQWEIYTGIMSMRKRSGELVVLRGDLPVRVGDYVERGSSWYEVYAVDTRYVDDKPTFDVCSVVEVTHA